MLGLSSLFTDSSFKILDYGEQAEAYICMSYR